MTTRPLRRSAAAGSRGPVALTQADRSVERAEELRLLHRKLDGVSIFAAGVANVVLQLSWPEVGYGVVESRVESGQATKHPFKRFRTTIGYVGVAMLGSDEQRLAYRHAINGQHRQVRSTTESPVKYNAFDRDLQLWVASCLYYGLRDAMTRMHGPLTEDEEVVLLRAGARFGTTLQLPAEMWHRTPAEFWMYWDAGLAHAGIDARVGSYLRGLLRIQQISTPLDGIVGPAHEWLNTGFIPEPIRAQLGLSWSPRDQRRHDRLMRSLGFAGRRLPHAVRGMPITTMVWDLEIRRRLGKPLV